MIRGKHGYLQLLYCFVSKHDNIHGKDVFWMVFVSCPLVIGVIFLLMLRETGQLKTRPGQILSERVYYGSKKK